MYYSEVERCLGCLESSIKVCCGFSVQEGQGCEVEFALEGRGAGAWAECQSQGSVNVGLEARYLCWFEEREFVGELGCYVCLPDCHSGRDRDAPGVHSQFFRIVVCSPESSSGCSVGCLHVKVFVQVNSQVGEILQGHDRLSNVVKVTDCVCGRG